MNKTEFDVYLRKNGLKNTKHRAAILNILDMSSQPIAAEQIFQETMKMSLSINLSTVYRTLEILFDKNLVTKLSIDGDNRTLFEINHMLHRHHLVCISCKKILTVEHCPLEDYEKILAKETNYTIAGHKLDIYGYCPDCRDKQPAGGFA